MENTDILRLYIDGVSSPNNRPIKGFPKKESESIRSFFGKVGQVKKISKADKLEEFLIHLEPPAELHINKNIPTKYILIADRYVNPLDCLLHLSSSLDKLGKCLALQESHLLLKEKAVSFLENVFTRLTVRVPNIESQIERLEHQLSDKGEYASRRKKLNILISESALREENARAAKNLHQSPGTLKARNKAALDTLAQIRRSGHVHQQDIINELEASLLDRLRIRISDDQYHSISRHHDSMISKTQLMSEKQQHIMATRDAKRQLKHLEKIHNSESNLANLIIAAHADGGPLDFANRWKVIETYFAVEMKSAHDDFVAALYGMLQLDNQFKSYISSLSCLTLRDFLNSGRVLIDVLTAFSRRSQNIILRVKLEKLMKYPNITLAKYPEFDSLNGNRIFCHSVNVVNYCGEVLTPMVAITPPKQKEFQPETVYLSVSPSDEQDINKGVGQIVRNSSFFGKWKFSTGLENTKDIFVVFELAVGVKSER